MNLIEARLLDHQAKLTAPLRKHIYRIIGLPRLKKVVDVGCGTGIITREIAKRGVSVIGVDSDPKAIERARSNYPDIEFYHVKKGTLPFPDKSFDLAFCHFVLMWQKDGAGFLREMARVVRKGGWIVVAAEPDFSGRVVFPDDNLTGAMERATTKMGGDPFCGGKLRALFLEAGLDCEVGVWPSILKAPSDKEDFIAEWEYYTEFLKDSDDAGLVNKALPEAQKADREGGRLVFLPLFFAYAWK